MAPPNALQQMRVFWKMAGESQILLKVVNGTWLECLHFLPDLNKTGYRTLHKYLLADCEFGTFVA
jgi:hypothetical protein